MFYMKPFNNCLNSVYNMRSELLKYIFKCTVIVFFRCSADKHVHDSKLSTPSQSSLVIIVAEHQSVLGTRQTKLHRSLSTCKSIKFSFKLEFFD